jgi:hypothetical protein
MCSNYAIGESHIYLKTRQYYAFAESVENTDFAYASSILRDSTMALAIDFTPSERKILVFVFGKVQHFCLERYALAGIVFEFSTAIGNTHVSFFCTKNIFFLEPCTIYTIAARSGNLFSE